jgi:hypothetical protein
VPGAALRPWVAPGISFDLQSLSGDNSLTGNLWMTKRVTCYAVIRVTLCRQRRGGRRRLAGYKRVALATLGLNHESTPILEEITHAFRSFYLNDKEPTGDSVHY